MAECTTPSITESVQSDTNSPSDLKVLSKTTTSPPQTEVTNLQTHNKLVKINQVIKSSIRNGTVNPSRIAEFITTKYHFIIDEETNTLWIYEPETGIYSNKSKIIIDKEIKKLLRNQCRARYSQDVEYNIRTTVPTGIMDTEKPELLAVQNGVLKGTPGNLLVVI